MELKAFTVYQQQSVQGAMSGTLHLTREGEGVVLHPGAPPKVAQDDNPRPSLLCRHTPGRSPLEGRSAGTR